MDLALQLVGTYDDVLATTQWGEARGLAAVSLPDHYLYGEPPYENPAPDALTQLAGLARETNRVELSTLVSPVTFRHPAVYAKMAMTLDDMSGGRFTLGLGTGWMDAEHEIFDFPYPPMTERFELLENHLAYVRAAIGPGESSYEGSHYSLQPLELQPAASPRIVVGGGGPKKTPYLAGTYADEFNVYAQPPDAMRERIERCHEAADAAGRNPEDILITTACPPLIGATDEDYQAALAEFAESFGSPAEDIEERFDSRGLILGTPERFAPRIAAWKELGVTRFYMQRITVNKSLEEAGILIDLIAAAAAG